MMIQYDYDDDDDDEDKEEEENEDDDYADDVKALTNTILLWHTATRMPAWMARSDSTLLVDLPIVENITPAIQVTLK